MSFKAALLQQQQPRIFTVEGSDSPKTSETMKGSNKEPNSMPQGGNILTSSIDSFSHMSTAHRLNGNNYLQWSRFVLMFVRGRDKEQYLTGNPLPPDRSDSSFKVWCAENNLVMTWLVNSMTPEIGEKYLLATTAHKIWESVKMTYSVQENTAALAQVKRSLRAQSQGEQSVTQYYSSLVKLWQQLDLYEVFDWSCSKDIAYHKKVLDHDRCYDFLLGLNDTFEDLRGRIWSLKPLPPLQDAFNMIKCEESRKVLHQSPFVSSTNNSSALTVRGPQSTQRGQKLSKWCDHCSKRGHTREECWKLHGKPANLDQPKKTDGKGMLAEVPTTDDSRLSTDELLILRKLLEKYNHTSAASSENSSPSVTLVRAG